MLFASNHEKPRTIGAGRGGVTDKILYGSDSRRDQIDPLARARSTPPSLQDVVFQSLTHELVRVILVDQTELIGKLLWYNTGRFCIKHSHDDFTQVLCCSRVVSAAPIEADEEAIPFITECMRGSLLANEERSSRLQIVRRRIRERNNRMAAAAKYSIHS